MGPTRPSSAVFGYPPLNVHGTLPPVPLPRLQAPPRPRQRHQPDPDSSDSEPQDKDRADLIPQHSGFHVPRPRSRSSLAVSIDLKNFSMFRPQWYFYFRIKAESTMTWSTTKVTCTIYRKTISRCPLTGRTIERETKQKRIPSCSIRKDRIIKGKVEGRMNSNRSCEFCLEKNEL